ASIAISSSVGVVLYPDHADEIRDLLRSGDEAMYRAKKAGRNAVELFRREAASAADEAAAAAPEPAAGRPRRRVRRT
ncbi:MAG TPA: diguanylate cyclase, partial [Burkholderiaceae bacterium]